MDIVNVHEMLIGQTKADIVAVGNQVCDGSFYASYVKVIKEMMDRESITFVHIFSL